MDSTMPTTDGDIKLNSDLIDPDENLRIQLQEKDQELEKNKESFPSPDISYYIKRQSESQDGQFLYIRSETDSDYHFYLRSSTGNQSWRQFMRTFQFTKYWDGTFSIYTQGRYLQTHTNKSSRIGFTGNASHNNAEKFVLFFHPQNQQTGITVDISTLDGYFLCVDNENYVAANSRIPPADKFLIIPVGVQ